MSGAPALGLVFGCVGDLVLFSLEPAMIPQMITGIPAYAAVPFAGRMLEPEANLAQTRNADAFRAARRIKMSSHGRSAIITGIFLFILMVLHPERAYCAAQPTSPVEITGVRLTWVGSQSNVNPKEKGDKTFWKGSKPPSSADYGTTDRLREVVTSGNWGKIDVEFTTYRTWEDSIEFVFYMLIKDKDGFKMLKGNTTALFVAQGKAHYVVMYAYPNAIARYGGDVQAVAVQAVVNGKAVSAASEPKVNKPWWEEYSPVGGAIIDWFYTPMGRNGVDGYELIKTIK